MKNNYIQKEHEKIYGKKSPFSNEVTFQIVKTFYLAEIFKLEVEKNKMSKNGILIKGEN